MESQCQLILTKYDVYIESEESVYHNEKGSYPYIILVIHSSSVGALTAAWKYFLVVSNTQDQTLWKAQKSCCLLHRSGTHL